MGAAPYAAIADDLDLAADALAVLDELGIEQAVVGGMSQGGYAALRMALMAPERVRGLALISTESDACTPSELAFYRTFFERWCGVEPLAPLVEGPGWNSSHGSGSSLPTIVRRLMFGAA